MPVVPGTQATSVQTAGGLVHIDISELKNLRGARGRFTSALAEQRRRNGVEAELLKAQVVSLTASSIERQAASTGRLLKVTADPRNAQYDNWSMGVGIPSFLDRSIAKYWRTFEEGSLGLWKHPFVGTQLMPVGKSKPPYPVAHGMTPGLRTTQTMQAWMDGSRYVVKHEIAPRHVYLQAATRADLPTFALASARRLISQIMATEFVVRGKG